MSIPSLPPLLFKGDDAATKCGNPCASRTTLPAAASASRGPPQWYTCCCVGMDDIGPRLLLRARLLRAVHLRERARDARHQRGATRPRTLASSPPPSCLAISNAAATRSPPSPALALGLQGRRGAHQAARHPLRPDGLRGWRVDQRVPAPLLQAVRLLPRDQRRDRVRARAPRHASHVRPGHQLHVLLPRREAKSGAQDPGAAIQAQLSERASHDAQVACAFVNY